MIAYTVQNYANMLILRNAPGARNVEEHITELKGFTIRISIRPSFATFFLIRSKGASMGSFAPLLTRWKTLRFD